MTGRQRDVEIVLRYRQVWRKQDRTRLERLELLANGPQAFGALLAIVERWAAGDFIAAGHLREISTLPRT